MMLNPFHFLTKLKTTHILKTCHSDGRCHEFSSVGWLMSNYSPSFLIFPPLMSFFLILTSIFFFSHGFLESNPREMMKWNVGVGIIEGGKEL